MPIPYSDSIATFPLADATMVGEAVQLLSAQRFTTVQPPMFGPDSGGAVLQRGDTEIHLVWFLESGLNVRCLNRAFEKERADVTRLLRGLGPSK
jgi:hypothetical protein